MPSSSRDQTEDRFDEILGNYFEAAERGPVGDWRELARRYPEFATKFKEFFADEAAVDANVRPIGAPKPKRNPSDATTLSGGRRNPNTVVKSFPRRFGGYDLLGELARGGMGVVYRARQISANRMVAVKTLLAGSSASPECRQRFMLEAEAAARLDHPNIVPIYDVADHEGQLYFSMKLVEGGSLAELLRVAQWQPGKSRQRWSAWLVARVARAVDFAHQHGVVHRDLKPGNILLEKRRKPNDDSTQVASVKSKHAANAAAGLSVDEIDFGSGLRQGPAFGNDKTEPWYSPLKALVPYVTDFGLAKLFDDNSGLTQSGAIVGTPNYMSPEQAAGQKDIGPASDVFSLGAILYHMLTGRRPFEAETQMATLDQVRTVEPPRPGTIVPVDRDLEMICMKCLEKTPAARYRSAAELAADLERYLKRQPISARPPRAWERLRRWSKKNAVAALLLAMVPVLMLVGVGSFVLAQYLRREQPIASRPTDPDEIILPRDTTPNTKPDTTPKTKPETKPTTVATVKWPGDQIDPSVFLEQFQKLLAAAQKMEQGDLKEAEEILNSIPEAARKQPWQDMMRRFKSTILLSDIESVACLDFSGDGSLVAAGNMRGQVQVWDARTREPLAQFVLGNSPVRSVTLRDRHIAAGDNNGLVRIWNVDQPKEKPLGEQDRDQGPIIGLRILPDGKSLVIVDRQISVWPFEEGKNPTAFPGPAKAHVAMDMDAKQNRLFTAADNKVQVWDWRTGGKVHEFEANAPLQSVRCGLDGTTLFAITTAGKFNAWQLLDNKPVAPPVCSGEVVRFALGQPDRGCGLTKQDQIQLFEGEPILRPGGNKLAPKGTRDLGYSLDGRYLVVGCEKGLLWFDTRDFNHAPKK